MAKKYRVYIKPAGQALDENTHKVATELNTGPLNVPSLADGDYETVVESYDQAEAVPFTVEAPSAPAAPSNLLIDDVTPTTVTLGWDTPATATSFQVQRSLDSGMTSPVQIYDGPGSQTIDTGRTPETDYWYQVRATNSVGSSAWSTAAQATTSPAISVILNLFLTQSQGIGVKASPRLGHATDSKVLMLGTKPALPLGTTPNDVLSLNLQTAEELEIDENGSEVDTMCVALGRDRLARIGSPASDNYRIINIISGEGAQSIDRLSKGGASFRYEYLVNAAQRVKDLCDANSWSVTEINFNWTHGGTATEGYELKLLTLIDDIRTDVGAIFSISGNNIYVFSDQIRQRNGLIQEPSTALASAILQTTNAKLVVNRNAIERVGDIVHLTANGTRHLAMYYSACHHETRMGSNAWKAPRMGTITFDEGTNEFTIPIIDHSGTPVSLGNFGFKVWNETLQQYEPFTSDLTSNVITLSLSSIASGSHEIRLRQMWEDDDEDYTRYFGADQVDEAAEATRGYLYYQNTGVFDDPIFDDTNTTDPYTLYLPMIREEKIINIEINVSPPTTYTLDYRGATTVDTAVDHPDSVTAYFVLYTTEASRSDATVKADALATGGTRRATVNNSDSLGSEKFQTWTGLTQNTTYYLHVAVEENATPDTFVESYNKVLQTRWRHEQVVYYYAPFAREKGCYLYVPETYWKRRDTNEKWPLLISYHGNGEDVGLGTPGPGQQYDFNAIDNVVYANRVQAGTNYNDFIIVSPQYGTSNVPNINEVEYIIDTVLRTNRGLQIRDGYLPHGLSGGGGVAYDYAWKFPEKVAAGASSAGFMQYTGTKDTPGGSNLTYDLYDDSITRKLSITPFVAAHNQGDTTVGDQQSKRLITGFQSYAGINSWGNVTSYLINPAGGGHNIWDAHVNQTLDYSTALPSAVPQANILAFFLNASDNFTLEDKLDACVSLAEDVLTQEYEDWARAAVQRSQSKIDSGDYDAFIARLDAVSDVSAADAAVTDAETSTVQGDYDDAFTLVNALPSGPKKTEFLDRLNLILIGEVAADALVTTAENTGDAGDKTAAQAAVTALDEDGNISGTPESEKTAKIAALQARIDAIGQIPGEVRVNIRDNSNSDSPASTSPNVNNTIDRFAVLQVANCIDINGVPTGNTITFLDAFSQYRATTGQTAPGAGQTALYDNNMATSQLWDTAGTEKRIQIGGLDPALRYDFFSSHTYNAGSARRETGARLYNSRGDADAYNTDRLMNDSEFTAPRGLFNDQASEMSWTDVRPNNDGTVILAVRELAGSTAGVINALRYIAKAAPSVAFFGAAALILLLM